MVLNTTTAEALDKMALQSYVPFLKQLVYALIGGVLARQIYKLGYHSLLKHVPKLFFLFSLLLILVFIPGIGQQINGANRWIGLHFFSFQPSEFMRIILPLFAIHYILQRKTEMNAKEFYLFSCILIIPIFLILFEPDNGTAAILIAVLMVLFFLTKIRAVYWALPFICLILLGAATASQMKHVPDRIRVYLNPELDLLGKGHQPYQAKIAAGSGKLIGRGLGESLQKLNYLPEARSDYIAAIFAEEFGFVGIVGLIVIYMSIIFLGFQIALNAPDKQGYYIAATLTFLIGLQAFLNLGVVSGLLPSKGTNLPFFSQGGSSLVANLIAISLLINVSEKRYERAT